MAFGSAGCEQAAAGGSRACAWAAKLQSASRRQPVRVTPEKRSPQPLPLRLSPAHFAFPPLSGTLFWPWPLWGTADVQSPLEKFFFPFFFRLKYFTDWRPCECDSVCVVINCSDCDETVCVNRVTWPLKA